MIMKPAPSVGMCAKEVQYLMEEAGWAHGEWQNLFCDTSDDVMNKVIGHQNIRGVSFTGSSVAGKNLASIAG